MSQSGDRCPKCDNPREPSAVDCPYCGIVYARYRPQEERPQEERPLSEPSFGSSADTPRGAAAGAEAGGDGLYSGPLPGADEQGVYTGEDPGPGPADLGGADRDDLYTGAPPSSPPPTTRPRLSYSDEPEQGTTTETFLTRNLAISLAGAVLVYLFLLAFLHGTVVSASDNLAEVRQQFRLLTGLAPPEPLTDVTTLTLAGQRFLLFAEEDLREDEFPTVVLLYRPRGTPRPGSLVRMARPKLEAMKLPWYPISSEDQRLRGEPVAADVLGIGNRRKTIGRVVSLAVPTLDGGTALLVVTGPTRRVLDLQRRYFS